MSRYELDTFKGVWEKQLSLFSTEYLEIAKLKNKYSLTMTRVFIDDYEIIQNSGQENLSHWQLWPVCPLKLKEKYSMPIIPIHIPKTLL